VAWARRSGVYHRSQCRTWSRGMRGAGLKSVPIV
jgi:hypothetical protein